MANKGLKNNLKQITGSVGNTKYYVNANKNDANLIFDIPIVSTFGPYPINVSLMYNYLNKGVNGRFGKGIKPSYEMNIEYSGNDIILYDSASTPTVFKKIDDETYESYDGTKIEYIFETDGDNETERYNILDKYGNRIEFDYGRTNIPGRLIYSDGTILGIGNNYLSNSIVDNKSSKIEYTESNGLVTEIVYKYLGFIDNEDGNKVLSTTTEILKTLLTYNENRELVDIKTYRGTNLISRTTIEYNTTYIKVVDEMNKYGIKFNIGGNKVLEIYEVFTDSNIERNIYSFQYFAGNYTKVTDRLGNYKVTVFNDNDYITYEYDNHGNMIGYDFDEEKNLLLFQSEVIHVDKLLEASMASSSDFNLVLDTYPRSEFIEDFHFQNPYIINEAASYEYDLSSEDNSNISLAFMAKVTGDGDLPKASIKAYNKNQFVESSEVVIDDEEYKLIVVGLSSNIVYDKVKVEFNITGKELLLSDLILVRKSLGTYYEYNEKSDIVSIKNGQNVITYGYENNRVSNVSTNNIETVYEKDEHGNPTKIINSYGVTTNKEYSDNLLLKEDILSELGNQITSYTYENGQVKSVNINNEVLVENNYDVYGRNERVSVTDTNINPDNSFETCKKIVQYNLNDTVNNIYLKNSTETEYQRLHYNYNDNLTLDNVVALNGSQVKYYYDNNRRLIKVCLNNSVVTEYVYDTFDNLISKKYSDNNYYNFSYDTDNKLRDVYYKNLLRYEYEYDDYNRVESITNRVLNKTTNIEYDTFDNVVSISEGNDKVSYVYDSDYNLSISKYDIEGSELVNSYDTVSYKKEHVLEQVDKTLYNKNYYHGFFSEDSKLLGKYEGNNVLITPAHESYTNICTMGNHYVLELDDGNLVYSLPDENDNEYYNKGTFGLWFSCDGNKQLIKHGDETNWVGLYKKGNKLFFNACWGVNYEMCTLDESLDEHFACVSWKSYYANLDSDECLDLSLICDGKVYEARISMNSIITVYNRIHYIGPFNGWLTGLLLLLNQEIDKEEALNYYYITKEYLLGNDEPIDDEIVDRSSVSTYDNSGFDVIPLHNSLKSVKGVKPLVFDNNYFKVRNKKNIFDYNLASKKYCYVADGNRLVYKFGNSTMGTIVMKVFVNITAPKQYILQAKDNDSSYLGLYLDENLKLMLENDGIIDTNYQLTKKTWHFVGISYSGSNVRVFLDNQMFSSTITSPLTTEATTNIGCSINKVRYDSDIDDCYTNNPLYGQIQTLCFNNLYSDQTTINNLRNKLEVASKTQGYDELGRLTSKDIHINGEIILKNQYTYDMRDSIIEGLRRNVTFNNISSEVISNKTTNITTRNYTFDDLGNLKKVEDLLFGNKEYEYDYRGFLVKDNGTDIAYDSNGNISSYGNKTFVYDTTIKDRLMSVDGNSILYQDSNPLYPYKYKDLVFNYEGKNFIGYSKQIDNETYYDLVYKYNHQGLRIKKEISYTYMDDRDAEYETTNYYYDGNKLITEITDTLRNDYLYDEFGLLYGFIQTKNNIKSNYYYVRDCLQNILGIVDSNGNLVVKYNYDAYGNKLSEENNNNIYNPFRWKGYYYDEETGLFYCNSRYYVPKWCRWLTPDDVEYLEPESINGLNLYNYANNNPIEITYIRFSVGGKLISSRDTTIYSYSSSDKPNSTKQSSWFSFYKGVPVFYFEHDFISSFSFGFIFINTKYSDEYTLSHEWGHTRQLYLLGVGDYFSMIAIPSMICAGLSEPGNFFNINYHKFPWEVTADMFGGVKREGTLQIHEILGVSYLMLASKISNNIIKPLMFPLYTTAAALIDGVIPGFGTTLLGIMYSRK